MCRVAVSEATARACNAPKRRVHSVMCPIALEPLSGNRCRNTQPAKGLRRHAMMDPRSRTPTVAYSSGLRPCHRARWTPGAVPPRATPVADATGPDSPPSQAIRGTETRIGSAALPASNGSCMWTERSSSVPSKKIPSRTRAQ